MISRTSSVLASSESVQLGVDDVQGDEARLVLGQLHPQGALDDLQGHLTHLVLLGVEGFDLPQQLIGVVHPVFVPLKGKGNMVGEGDVHIPRQVPTQQTLGALNDLGAHLQVLRRQLHHQLGQALGLAVVLQGVHLLHPGRGHHVPWGFLRKNKKTKPTVPYCHIRIWFPTASV